MTRNVMDGDQLIAVYIAADHTAPGINFLTEDSATMQIATMNHPKNKIIASHTHRPVPRELGITQEVLVIRKGRIRVDLFDIDDNYLESIILKRGDVILLASGGHGFEVLEDMDMIEVKSGPYVADDDKRLFEAKLPDKLIFRD